MTGWRAWLGIAFCGAMTFVLIVTSVLPAPPDTPGLPLLSKFGVVVFGCMTAYAVALYGRYSVTFHPDAVDIAQVFSRRRVLKTDITSWSHGQNDNDWAALISLNLKDGKRVELPLVNVKHSAITAWFADIPNLETQLEAASMKTLLADRRLGDSPEKRLRTLNRERRIAWIASLVGIGATLWLAIWPKPYDLALAICLVLPLVAAILAILLRDRWDFVEGAAVDQRPSAVSLYLLPILALALRASTDSRVIDYPRLILIGCIFAVVAWVAINLLRQTKRWLSFGQTGLILIVALYGWSAATLLNFRLDHIKREVVPVEILAFEADGDAATITLAAGGPFKAAHTADIPSWAQARLPVGATANIYVYTGPLGARWWMVGIPPASLTSPP